MGVFQRLGRRTRSGDAPDAMLATICMLPIGVVRSAVGDPRRADWSGVRAAVEVEARHREALAGLDGFSHALVVTWLHLVSDDERALDTVHPAGDSALPRVGVLALRTHHRPNPIGVTVVCIEWVEGARVIVRGLDAVDGTPVLDIKPYVPFYDCLLYTSPSPRDS